MCQVPYEYNMPAGNKEDRLEDKAENKQLKVTYTKYSQIIMCDTKEVK